MLGLIPLGLLLAKRYISPSLPEPPWPHTLKPPKPPRPHPGHIPATPFCPGGPSLAMGMMRGMATHCIFKGFLLYIIGEIGMGGHLCERCDWARGTSQATPATSRPHAGHIPATSRPHRGHTGGAREGPGRGPGGAQGGAREGQEGPVRART